MSQECLRTGDKALVRCRFIKLPEYLRSGQRLVLREGRTKAVGIITQIFPDAPSGNYDLQPFQQQRSGPSAGKPSGQGTQHQSGPAGGGGGPKRTGRGGAHSRHGAE